MSFVIKPYEPREAKWGQYFAEQMPEMEFHVWPEYGDPEKVEYLAVWRPLRDLGTLFPNLKLLFSLGAGVDQFKPESIPPSVGLVHMVEPGLTQGMIEYVLFCVLSLQRDMHIYARQQREKVWKVVPERLAQNTRVGVMGLGALGTPVAKAIASIGYDCRGWNRSPREIEGVRVFSGADTLDEFLGETDILVCLLPLTDATRGMFNAELFSKLPRGAHFVNAGRGGHVVQEDLIAALDSGQLGHAIIDVTTPEPLPEESPIWTHPGITLTPHAASITQPDTGASAVIANIRRFESGQPVIGLTDRNQR